MSGSPTEKAILQWGIQVKVEALHFFILVSGIVISIFTACYDGYVKSQLGMNFEAVRAESSIIHVFPFNSEKKRGGVAVQTVMCLSFRFIIFGQLNMNFSPRYFLLVLFLTI